jgi:hypothetical protein
MKKHIGFIELIIVICVIVVSVRLWTQHKDPEAKITQHTSRTTVTIPTPLPTVIDISPCYDYDSGILCPNCGTTGFIIIDYKDFPHNTKKQLPAICSMCGWSSFKCPKCGSKDFILSPQYTNGKDGQLKVHYPKANCKKCGWCSSK